MVWDFLINNLVWTEGQQILFVLIMLGLAGFIWFQPLFYGVLLICAFSFYFFRNPHRQCLELATDPSIIVCPADGKIVDIQYDSQKGLCDYAQKVSIFLSPLDVHVNWIPMTGNIKRITYKPGAFKFAFLPKSSELNERNDVLTKHSGGQQILVRQIAGSIARRICCWVKEGQEVFAGQKFGMIRFGSRVDVFLPESVELAIKMGQHVYGGQTVLGRWQCDR